MGKEVFTARREEWRGEYEWLKSRESILETRKRNISKTLVVGRERGQELVWVEGVEFQGRREERKGDGVWDG